MKYKVVDVFTNVPFKGNPVAVVKVDDPSKLDDRQMQAIARWTNLSETTFILPNSDPRADYQVRIFTPGGELPFAGHPTLGTLHASIEWGLVDNKKSSWVQNCLRGSILIRRELEGSSAALSFGIDGMTSTPIDISEIKGCLPGLTIKGAPALVDAGARWVVLAIEESEEELLKAKPAMELVNDFSRKAKADGLCVFTTANKNSDDIQLRTFAPILNVPEDPVCGSGNAAVAYYRHLLRPYKSSQGAALNRDGHINLDYRDNMIWVGGECTTVVDGDIKI